MVAEDTVEQLIEKLESGNPDQQGVAAKILRERPNARAINALIEVLKAENLEAREYATYALSVSGEKAIQPLIDILSNEKEDHNSLVRAGIAHNRIGKPAIQPLLTLLNDPHPVTRNIAAYSMPVVNNTRVIQALIHALKDTSLDVRYEAVYSLRQIGSSMALPALIKLQQTITEDASLMLRQEIERAIARIQGSEHHKEFVKKQRRSG